MSTIFCLYVSPEHLAAKGRNITVIAHHLIGYCPQSIADYRKMATTLRKTFPQAKDSDLHCRQVTKSDSVDGFTLLTWAGDFLRTELGLPGAKRWATLVDAYRAADPHRLRGSSYPALPEYKGWSLTARKIDYCW